MDQNKKQAPLGKLSRMRAFELLCNSVGLNKKEDIA